MTTQTDQQSTGRRTQITSVIASDLMTTQDAAIGRIRLCFGIDSAEFDAQILPIIRRLCHYIVNLPATRNAHYSQPGGMFQLALRVGFFSLQGADGHIFAGRSTISVRRQLEPRWRLATFIAGLLSILDLAAGRAIVEDGAGSKWPSLLVPLGSWLEGNEAHEYSLSWRRDPHDAPGFGLLALPLVVPAETLAYLAADNDDVLPALLASVAGLSRYRDHNSLPKLVGRAFALVVHEWTTKSGMLEHENELDPHIRRYVLDTMRRLAATHPHWLANREKSRVWLGSDGVFIVWPQAASDIIGIFEEDELAGMPRSAEAIVAVLEAEDVLEPVRSGRGSLWLIQPPPSPGPVGAIRLVSHAVLYPFSDEPPAPLSIRLAAAPPEVASIPVPTPPRPGNQLHLNLQESGSTEAVTTVAGRQHPNAGTPGPTADTGAAPFRPPLRRS